MTQETRKLEEKVKNLVAERPIGAREIEVHSDGKYQEGNNQENPIGYLAKTPKKISTFGSYAYSE